MPYDAKDITALRLASGLNKEKFAKSLGVSRYWLHQLEEGKKDPGELVQFKLVEMKSKLGLQKDNNPNRIPFYDVEAAAGNEHGMDLQPVDRPVGSIDVGDFLRDSECAIRIYGNSMMPNYPSGCVVGLRECKDGIIDYGNVYVIETEDNRYFKRIYKDKEKKGHTCYSDNTKTFTEGPRAGEHCYEPFVVPFNKVKRLFRVVGMIKRNENSAIFG